MDAASAALSVLSTTGGASVLGFLVGLAAVGSLVMLAMMMENWGGWRSAAVERQNLCAMRLDGGKII